MTEQERKEYNRNYYKQNKTKILNGQKELRIFKKIYSSCNGTYSLPFRHMDKFKDYVI